MFGLFLFGLLRDSESLGVKFVRELQRDGWLEKHDPSVRVLELLANELEDENLRPNALKDKAHRANNPRPHLLAHAQR
jgi:hypothetical protein